ncbi:MAG: translation initiation factor IF-2 [Nitrospirota bacterium]|jgi:translation initiation factor IF-2
MAISVHGLSKELGVDPKKLMAELKKFGVEVRTELTAVPKEGAEEMRNRFADTGPKEPSKIKVRKRRKAKPAPAEAVEAGEEAAAVAEEPTAPATAAPVTEEAPAVQETPAPPEEVAPAATTPAPPEPPAEPVPAAAEATPETPAETPAAPAEEPPPAATRPPRPPMAPALTGRKIDADIGPAVAKRSELGEVVGHIDLAAHRTITTRAGGGVEYGEHERRSKVEISKHEGRRPGVHVVSIAEESGGPLPTTTRPTTGRGKKVVTTVVAKKGPKGKKGAKPSMADALGRGSRHRYKARRRRRDLLVQAEAEAANEVIDLTGEAGEGQRVIAWDEAATVGDLAKQMEVPVNEVVLKLMDMGVMASVNQTIDQDTAALLAAEYSCNLSIGTAAAVEAEDELIEKIGEEEINEEDLEPRPPVVTVMGHVDHGKTTVLDYLRKSHVTAGEAGGITQHIGAYQVHLDQGAITFLDTPGHEAFTAIRARGAKVTDLVVLVVAANDGVMPQTVEAINHARAAEVPIVVAINKIDLPEANPDRVKQQLTKHNLIAEDYGGDVPVVPVSAKTGEGIDHLLEIIFLQAEVMELVASPAATARGVVIEAKVDKGRGVVATILVQSGTLRRGDVCVVGSQYGRIRAMTTDRGEQVQEAGPSVPVEIQGLAGAPDPGDDLIVLESERDARQVADARADKRRKLDLTRGDRKSTLESMLAAAMQEGGEAKILPVVIKGDVQGSVEAVSDTLQRISTEQVRLQVIHSAVGAINETDVDLARASEAIIIGFNVRPTPAARKAAEAEHVDIRLHNIIYKLAEEIREAMEGLLEATYREKIIGRAEIREVFNISKLGNIGGSYVLEGVVQRNAEARLLRDNVVVHTGKIGSVRRFKDDVKEVAAGFECGIGLAGYHDIKPGDILEVFVMEAIAAKL